jgi:hypothetical protein
VRRHSLHGFQLRFQNKDKNKSAAWISTALVVKGKIERKLLRLFLLVSHLARIAAAAAFMLVGFGVVVLCHLAKIATAAFMLLRGGVIHAAAILHLARITLATARLHRATGFRLLFLRSVLSISNAR